MQVIAPVIPTDFLAADQLPLLKLEFYFPDNRLGTMYFDSGSVEPQVNEILTGATSGATAKVFSVTKTANTWAGTDAVGYIILLDCSGCFNNNEDIDGDVGGGNMLTVNHSDGAAGVDKLVKNGAFVATINDWTAIAANLTNVEGGVAGGNCMQVASSGAALGKAYQDITTVVGETYELSLHFKKGTSATGKFMIGIVADEDSIYDSGVLSDAAWTAYSHTFVATATTTRITMQTTDPTATENSLFDEITVYELDEWINLNALVGENYVEGESLSLGGASMTPNPVEGIWSATLFNQDGIFHPQHPTSAYKDYVRTERQVKLSLGATYGGTDYYWQRVIGYMNVPNFSIPDYRVAISGGDYMKRLRETELRIPDNYWGSIWITSSISSDGLDAAEVYDAGDAMDIVADANNVTDWDSEACDFTFFDAGGADPLQPSNWVGRLENVTPLTFAYVHRDDVADLAINTTYKLRFKYRGVGEDGTSSIQVRLFQGGTRIAMQAFYPTDDWLEDSIIFTAIDDAVLEMWVVCTPGIADLRLDEFSIRKFTPYWERYYDLKAHNANERSVHHVMLKPNATWEDVWQGEIDEGWYYTEDEEPGPEPPYHPAGIVFFDPNKTVAAGDDNLKIYYFTQQEAEDIVASLLYKAKVSDPATGVPYVDEPAALVAIEGHVEYVYPNVQIDKAWFKPGTTCLEAIMKICERCNYRFYFDYDGTPVFRPKPVTVDPPDFIFTAPKHIASIDTYQDRGEIKNRIVIRGIKQAEPTGREETTDSDYYTGEASDATSIAAYGERTLTINNHLFQDNIDNITGVTVGGAGAGEFKVAGDLTARYLAADILIVKGSTNNDGIYTISAGGSAHAGGTTTIPVDEAVAAVADGTIHTQTAVAAMCTSLLTEYKDPKWYSTLKMPFNPVPLVMGDTIQWEERLSSNLDITQVGVIRDIKINNFDTTYKCELYDATSDFLDDFCDDVIGPKWTEQNTDADRTFVESGCKLTVGIDGVSAYHWFSRVRSPMLYRSYPSEVVGKPIRITARLNSYAINANSYAGLLIGSNKYINDKLWIQFESGKVEPNDGETIRDANGLQGDWQSDDYYIVGGSWDDDNAYGYACLKNKTANIWHGFSACKGSDHGATDLFTGRNDTLVAHAHIWHFGMMSRGVGPDLILRRNNGQYDFDSDDTLPVWLQIRVSTAGTVTFWYSHDGIAYTQYEDSGNPFSINLPDIKGYDPDSSTLGLVVGLIGAAHGVATFEAPFEFFKIDKFTNP